jgi:GNAT superfamily N-acetyltransferase
MTSEGKNISVRRATNADPRAIAQVHVNSWRAAYPGLIPERLLERLSVDRRERQWADTLAAGEDKPIVLVAESDDDQLVGFSTVAIPARDADEADDVAEIPAIYVAPEAWGHGVGHALIEASVNAMRDAGCREAILWAVAGNDRAAAFYVAEGWHDDGGRRPSQYFPDASEVVEVRFRRAL